MRNLQNELTEAVVSGNYSDIARVMGDMNSENAKKACLHVFVRLAPDDGGWPRGHECKHCHVKTPEVFCRHPGQCVFAGRCTSVVACND